MHYHSFTNFYLQRISNILNENVEREFVIICNSSKNINNLEVLQHIDGCMSRAQKKGADIFIGGVKNFEKKIRSI